MVTAPAPELTVIPFPSVVKVRTVVPELLPRMLVKPVLLKARVLI